MARPHSLFALPLSASILLGSLVTTGCGGPAFVRDTDLPTIDEYALSTGLDRRDLERLFAENEQSLAQSGAMRRWKDASREGKELTVAIFPVRNETSEHIDSQLSALLSKFETQLVNSGYVTVVSREQQNELIEELRLQQSAAFDPDKAAQLGRQLGAQYFITGKIFDAAEKSEGERRVQYFLFMQAIDIETGAVRWQNEAALTKALVR